MEVLILPLNVLNRNSHKKLSKRKIKQASKYIFFGEIHPNIFHFFDRMHCSLLEPEHITKSEGEDLLKQYVDIIGQISSINYCSKSWWATDISSKNRLLSPMQETLNQFIFSKKAVDQCVDKKVDLYILGISWHVSVGVKNYAKLKKITVKIENQFLSKLRNTILGIRKTWLYLIRAIPSAILNIYRANIVFNSYEKINNDKPVFLIKSFIFSKSITEDLIYQDQFFGDIHNFLKKKLDKEDQVVTIVQGFVDRYLCYKKMQYVPNKIIPAEYFLRFYDTFLAGLSISWYWAFCSINIPNTIQLFNSNISSMLRELVASNGKTILFGDYLYFYLARRLAKRYKLKACLMTYEGNHWERMFIMGLRSVYPDLKIIGYQHSVVPPSAAGMFVSKYEIDIIPRPDKIITTGSVTASILKKYSFFTAENINSGAALRYKYLYNLDKIKNVHNEPYIILVALEGALEASSLLQYVINQAKILSNIRFIIRAHPVITLDTLIKFSKIKWNDVTRNIEVSHSSEVFDDVSKSHAVLYWGSTISVEALMIGKPLICFDRGDALSYDPLYEFTSFKWNVNSNSNLTGVVNEIQLMRDNEYKLKRDEGIKYVKKYFVEPSQNNMNFFIS